MLNSVVNHLRKMFSGSQPDLPETVEGTPEVIAGVIFLTSERHLNHLEESMRPFAKTACADSYQNTENLRAEVRISLLAELLRAWYCFYCVRVYSHMGRTSEADAFIAELYFQPVAFLNSQQGLSGDLVNKQLTQEAWQLYCPDEVSKEALFKLHPDNILGLTETHGEAKEAPIYNSIIKLSIRLSQILKFADKDPAQTALFPFVSLFVIEQHKGVVNRFIPILPPVEP